MRGSGIVVTINVSRRKTTRKSTLQSTDTLSVGARYTGLQYWLHVTSAMTPGIARMTNTIAKRRVPELIPVVCSQPAGDVSRKPGGRLPLLSARPAVTLATLKRAATNFAAW